MKKYFFYSSTILLGLFLIFLGCKGLSDITHSKEVFRNTIELFELSLLSNFNIDPKLHLLREHPIEILYFENLCIIWGGFLLIFGFDMSSTFVITGLLVEIVFMHNILFYNDINTITSFSLLIALFSGVLIIKKN